MQKFLNENYENIKLFESDLYVCSDIISSVINNYLTLTPFSCRNFWKPSSPFINLLVVLHLKWSVSNTIKPKNLSVCVCCAVLCTQCCFISFINHFYLWIVYAICNVGGCMFEFLRNRSPIPYQRICYVIIHWLT